MAKCYGKLAPKNTDRVPRLVRYLATVGNAPVAPESCGWTNAVSTWPMYGNNRIGDCTCASAGHQIQAWSANAGNALTPTEQAIIDTYVAVAHYDPYSGANDNGAAITDVLNYWRDNGIAGNRITAYTAIDQSNVDHLKLGIYLFGGVTIGTAVTQAAEQQTDTGQPWYDGWWFSPVLGLHCIPLLGYDSQYFYAVSWGQVVRITYEYASRRFDEAYGVVDTAFLNSQGQTPTGLNLQQLLADQAAVSG